MKLNWFTRAFHCILCVSTHDYYLFFLLKWLNPSISKVGKVIVNMIIMTIGIGHINILLGRWSNLNENNLLEDDWRQSMLISSIFIYFPSTLSILNTINIIYDSILYIVIVFNFYSFVLIKSLFHYYDIVVFITFFFPITPVTCLVGKFLIVTVFSLFQFIQLLIDLEAMVRKWRGIVVNILIAYHLPWWSLEFFSLIWKIKKYIWNNTLVREMSTTVL